jgi:hypothetical protein
MLLKTPYKINKETTRKNEKIDHISQNDTFIVSDGSLHR